MFPSQENTNVKAKHFRNGKMRNDSTHINDQALHVKSNNSSCVMEQVLQIFINVNVNYF